MVREKFFLDTSFIFLFCLKLVYYNIKYVDVRGRIWAIFIILISFIGKKFNYICRKLTAGVISKYLIDDRLSIEHLLTLLFLGYIWGVRIKCDWHLQWFDYLYRHTMEFLRF